MTTREMYMMINFFEKSGIKDAAADKYVAELKREIRKQNRKTAPHYVCADYESAIVLEECPAEVVTEEEALEWFEYNKFIEPVHSAYDCTGRLFTAWYKPVCRRGKWFVYHSIERD